MVRKFVALLLMFGVPLSIKSNTWGELTAKKMVAHLYH